MNTFSTLPARALQLATQVGGGIKDAVPDKAIQWLETGAALGAFKTGSRVATKFVRRNPVVAVVAAASAGLLWYAVRQRAKQAQNGPIEGKATRVEAKRATGSRRTARSNGQRSRPGKPTE